MLTPQIWKCTQFSGGLFVKYLCDEDLDVDNEDNEDNKCNESEEDVEQDDTLTANYSGSSTGVISMYHL